MGVDSDRRSRRLRGTRGDASGLSTGDFFKADGGPKGRVDGSPVSEVCLALACEPRLECRGRERKAHLERSPPPVPFFFLFTFNFYGSRAYLLADVPFVGSTRRLMRRVRRPERTKARPLSGRSRTQLVEPHRTALRRCERSNRLEQPRDARRRRGRACVKNTHGSALPASVAFLDFSLRARRSPLPVASLPSVPRMRSNRIRSRGRALSCPSRTFARRRANDRIDGFDARDAPAPSVRVRSFRETAFEGDHP